MASDKTVLYFGPGRTGPSPIVSRFVEENGLELDRVDQVADLRALLNRTMPACVIMESDSDSAEFVEIIRVLKQDSFTSIVPLMVLLKPGDDGVSDLLAAGADDILFAFIAESFLLCMLLLDSYSLDVPILSFHSYAIFQPL